jgi:hypothetical protein
LTAHAEWSTPALLARQQLTIHTYTPQTRKRQSLGTDSPDLFLGLLQSAFIVGFSLAALVFGHAIHYCRPFRMVGCVRGQSVRWIAQPTKTD